MDGHQNYIPLTSSRDNDHEMGIFLEFLCKIIPLTHNLLIAWSLQCLPGLSESELDSEADDSLSELALLSILCPELSQSELDSEADD